MNYWINKRYDISSNPIFLIKIAIMKKIILSLLLLPCISFSQKIILIDPALQSPPVYSDKLTINQLEKGFFFINEKDLPAVIKSIEAYRNIVDAKMEIRPGMKAFKTGNTYYTSSNKGERYSIVVDTKINKMGTFLILSKKDRPRKENLQQIDKFLAYLRNNKT